VTTLSRWFEVLNMTGTNESKRRAAALRIGHEHRLWFYAPV
jgi:hypothetical protein